MTAKNSDVDELNARAGHASENGDWDDAIAYAKQAIAAAPEEYLAYKRLALALWSTGLRDEAIVALTRCLELNPEFESGHYNMACFHAKLGDHAAALVSLRTAIELSSSYQAMALGDDDFAAMRDDDAFRALCGATGTKQNKAWSTALKEGDARAVADVLGQIGTSIPVTQIGWTGEAEDDDGGELLVIEGALERCGDELPEAVIEHVVQQMIGDAHVEQANYPFNRLCQLWRAKDRARCDALLCEAWTRRYAGKDAEHMSSFDEQIVEAVAECEPALAARTILACVRGQPDAHKDFLAPLASLIERLAASGPPELLAELIDVIDRRLHGTAYAGEPLERRRTRVALALPAPTLDVPDDPNDDWARERVAIVHPHPGITIPCAKHLLIQHHHPEIIEALVPPQAPRMIAWALATDLPVELRIKAIEVLGAIGKASSDALAPIFDETPTALIKAAAMAIGGSPGAPGARAPAAVERLIETYRAPADNWTVRYAALGTLRYFDDPRVVPTLLAALADKEAAIRREAAYGLGFKRDGVAVPALIEQLRKGNDQMVVAASRALDQIGSPEAHAALADEANYQNALKLATSSLGARFAAASLEQFRLPRVGDDLVMVATKIDDWEARHDACESLGRLGYEPAIPALIAMMCDRFKGEGSEQMFVTTVRKIVTRVSAPSREVIDAVGDALMKARPKDLTALAEQIPEVDEDDKDVATEPHRAAARRYAEAVLPGVTVAEGRTVVEKIFGIG